MTIALTVFLIAACAACYTDLRNRKIPNALTYAAMIAALAFAAANGVAALGIAFASLAATMVLGTVAFSFRWLGGGDVKLLAAAAATITYPQFLTLLVYVAFAGGVLALLSALAAGRLHTVVGSIGRSLIYRIPVAATSGVRRLPYALAIFAGTASYAASESFAPWLRLVH
jgi:prepilin peptidase CpaA